VIVKIPMGTRKNVFEIYRQFGHAHSKRFATSAVEGLGCFGDKQLHGKGQNCYTVHTFPTLLLSR